MLLSDYTKQTGGFCVNIEDTVDRIVEPRAENVLHEKKVPSV